MSVSNGHSRDRYSSSAVVYCCYVVKKAFRWALRGNSARVMDSDEDVTPAPVGRQQRHRAAPGHLINFDTSTQTPASEGVSTPGSAAPGPAERVLPTPARRTAPSFAPSPALSQSQSQSQSQEGVAVRETWTLPETEVFNKAYGEMLRNGQINALGNIQVPPPSSHTPTRHTHTPTQPWSWHMDISFMCHGRLAPACRLVGTRLGRTLEDMLTHIYGYLQTP